MTTTTQKTGKYLRTLADGEVGERRNWVLHLVESFRGHPDVTLTSDGDWTSYDSRPVFAVKRGRNLNPSTIHLGYADVAKESYATFLEVQKEQGLSGLTFQVGIPGDLDLSLFTFGPARAFFHRADFRVVLTRDIAAIAQHCQGDVLFQLEIPVELVMVATAPKPLRKLMASILASGISKLTAATPRNTRFGVHLCVGDLNNKALKQIRDTGPLVTLVEELVRKWPPGSRLEYVHMPLAAGDQPPPAEKAFYQPLSRLAGLPAGIRFVAGLVHERQELADQQQVLKNVEAMLGRRVDVAAACGLGRRTPEAASQVLDRAVMLVDS